MTNPDRGLTKASGSEGVISWAWGIWVWPAVSSRVVFYASHVVTWSKQGFGATSGWARQSGIWSPYWNFSSILRVWGLPMAIYLRLWLTHSTGSLILPATLFQMEQAFKAQRNMDLLDRKSRCQTPLSVFSQRVVGSLLRIFANLAHSQASGA